MANKYTIHQRIADAESRLTNLEAENKRLSTALVTELKTYVNDQANIISDSIRVPLDGKNGLDGAPGAVGAQGNPGDVLYIGPDDLLAAVAAIRAELLHQRAKLQAVVYQAIADANGPHSKLFRARLENLKRDAGL